eukprot:TRINITY_DN24214_c0_g1_i1.p1 TRINITY_DN24214_c0_g1~~TRINITY_DN24214_c0_g1_i1.p1  ORF type:complete len:389 (+),score=131.37 TRINITY_DN24214_c0_g1_i1:118-1284(+)
MLRSLVGSEMCIRDRYQRRVRDAFSAPMEDEGETRATEQVQGGEKKTKKMYRRDKPWDNASIDHWKVPEWSETDHKAGSHFLEESSFATLFPQYREKYLREIWSELTRTLDKHGVACELDCVEGSMMVKTTRKTRDPFIIFKARDVIKLLSRSVQLPQAVRVLEDTVYCDIVKIGGMVRNKERFVKRRQRLIGPNGSTLKAVELLTECYVLVQGRTVALIGEHKGLKQARKIVEDCMHNIHPIYNIKELMIRRELAKDETLKEENWDRFLPHFKQRAAKKKKKKVVEDEKKTKKKKGNPFPPEQTPRLVDKQLESGEYFLTQYEKKDIKKKEEQAAQEQAAVKKAKKRKKSFQEPQEMVVGAKHKSSTEEPVADLAARIKKSSKKQKK